MEGLNRICQPTTSRPHASGDQRDISTMSCSGRSHFLHRPQTLRHALERVAQRGQFPAHDDPYGIDVDREIVVHQDVPEAGDCTPWDSGFRSLDLVRQSLTGFRQRLKISDNGILNQCEARKSASSSPAYSVMRAMHSSMWTS